MHTFFHFITDSNDGDNSDDGSDLIISGDDDDDEEGDEFFDNLLFELSDYSNL